VRGREVVATKIDGSVNVELVAEAKWLMAAASV
jgi:hypothetical protein